MEKFLILIIFLSGCGVDNFYLINEDSNSTFNESCTSACLNQTNNCINDCEETYYYSTKFYNDLQKDSNIVMAINGGSAQ